MFTTEELQILIPLLDAGVKASGLQLFQNNGGVHLQSVLDKLQKMANEIREDENGGLHTNSDNS
jgi:hypothetical protein